MSAPHVAGVVARLLSRQNYLTRDEIRDLLIRSTLADFVQEENLTSEDDAATHMTDAEYKQRKWHPKWGYGIVDAQRTMDLLEERLSGVNARAGRARVRDTRAR